MSGEIINIFMNSILTYHFIIHIEFDVVISPRRIKYFQWVKTLPLLNLRKPFETSIKERPLIPQKSYELFIGRSIALILTQNFVRCYACLLQILLFMQP